MRFGLATEAKLTGVRFGEGGSTKRSYRVRTFSRLFGERVLDYRVSSFAYALLGERHLLPTRQKRARFFVCCSRRPSE